MQVAPDDSGVGFVSFERELTKKPLNLIHTRSCFRSNDELLDRLKKVRPATGQPLVAGGRHPGFGFHAQAVGDSIDVVEVANHLRGEAHLFVAKSVLPQSLNIVPGNVAGNVRQQNGVIAKGAVGIG